LPTTTSPQSAQQWADLLQLLPHPEGGWYKEMYRSQGTISPESLPSQFGGERSFSTSIYFLLAKGTFSAFHRILSDEVWHFYSGDALIIHEITPQGQYFAHRLGGDVVHGERFQLVIPARSWFASEVCEEGQYGLVGCTVAPGFDFRDFEMAQQSHLVEAFPQHAAIITRLCR
jgi:predicted cupin superfamily sugar epimerase